MVILPKNYPPVTEDPKKTEKNSLKRLLMQQIKQQNETIALLKESIDTNSKMIPKIGNNNNNTISINVFLNKWFCPISIYCRLNHRHLPINITTQLFPLTCRQSPWLDSNQIHCES